MAPKVFKIPDGKGGVVFQIQTPDGRWHDTDEDGNILPENDDPTEDVVGSEPDESPGPSIPKGRKKGMRPSPKDGDYVNFSLHFPKEAYKEFSDYIHWRCLFREPCSKSSFLMRLGLDAVGKDRDYRAFKEYMKKNSGTGPRKP